MTFAEVFKCWNGTIRIENCLELTRKKVLFGRECGKKLFFAPYCRKFTPLRQMKNVNYIRDTTQIKILLRQEYQAS